MNWQDHAACKGSTPDIKWHWSRPVIPAWTAPALAVCASCPVVEPCLVDMAKTGEAYPYQVRGGLVMWQDNIPTVPAPPALPKRRVGRPSGPLPERRSKDAPKYETYVEHSFFNPHTRGRWNTEVPDDSRT